MNIKPTVNSIQVTQERKSPIQPFEDVAEGMESNFTSYMLAEMRKTVPKETPDSSAMEYYNSLLDYERAQTMAKSESGLGIKKVILDQIVPQHMKHYLKPAPKASHPEVVQGMNTSTKEI